MVSPTKKIDADSEPIENLFKAFYAVPDFQREYIWKRRHVMKLLDDLHVAFTSKDADSYFLGSIVFFEEKEIFHLVDGQQRMTTLFLLVSAIRDRVVELDQDANIDIYKSAIRASYKARAGGGEYRYRVELQYPEIHEVLQAIGDGQADGLTYPKGESPRRNLITAYDLCYEFLVDRFGEDTDRLDEFFTFVWKDVELIAIHTEDMRSAFTIFETINDRGVGLDAMDLLKNLLFRQTRESSVRRQVAAKWKDLLSALRDGGESKPVRFLRYYLIANYKFDRVPTARGVFDWIVRPENRKLLGYGTTPARFADSLLKAAQAYGNFNQGLDKNGKESPYLAAINYQRTGVRQHLCLLLAARHLSAAAFSSLCRALETLVFVFAATNAQWNEIEKALPTWTQRLRDSRTTADVEALVTQEFEPRISERLPSLVGQLDDTSGMGDSLKKYLLASLTQHLENLVGKGGSFDRYYKENLTIEHVFPQGTESENPSKASREWLKRFGNPEDPGFFVHQLGNLTLLHRVPNSSARDDSFDVKRGWYRKSTFDLTRAIGEEISGGKKTKLSETVKRYGIRPYDDWQPARIEDRHRLLLQLAEDYWRLSLRDKSAVI